MAGSFDHIYLHLIFSVKDSASALRSDWHRHLQQRFAAILTPYGHQMMASHIAHDHVHLLVRYNPRMLIPILVQRLKKESRLWLQEHDPERAHVFRWQKGYAVFSVSRTRTAMVRRYIARQSEFHRANSLNHEMHMLLNTTWEDRIESDASDLSLAWVAEPVSDTFTKDPFQVNEAMESIYRSMPT